MKRYYQRGPYARRWSRSHQPDNALRAARLRAGMTQAQAAVALEMNRSQLAGYEGGCRPLPMRGDAANRIRRFIDAHKPPELP